MKTLENFKSQKIDLQSIQGSGVGGGLTTGVTHYSGSWAKLDTSTGEMTYSDDTIIWTELDQGSFY